MVSGQADGEVLAAVLFGDADASGRLPVTFAAETDYPTAETEAFPGEDGEVRYTEDLFVGYRHFDATDGEPVYPFGHGLSYAEFAYHGAEVISGRQVRVMIENTADRDGREVVQAYVSSDNPDGSRPVREFAGFEAVAIPAGETVTVTVELDDLAFSRYDDASGWADREGPLSIEIGWSAGDIEFEIPL